MQRDADFSKQWPTLGKSIESGVEVWSLLPSSLPSQPVPESSNSSSPTTAAKPNFSLMFSPTTRLLPLEFSPLSINSPYKKIFSLVLDLGKLRFWEILSFRRNLRYWLSWEVIWGIVLYCLRMQWLRRMEVCFILALQSCENGNVCEHGIN